MAFLYLIYQQPVLATVTISILILWTIVWQGLGLWFAARHRQKGWFIALLLLNTVGVLPIVYLIWFRPKTPRAETTSSVRVTGTEKKQPSTKRKKK